MLDHAIAVGAAGLDVEVRLNDVPTFRERFGRRIADENFINEFIAAGRNVLTLQVRPVGEGLEPGPEAQAIAELLSVERGRSISEGELLAQVEWPGPDTPPPPRRYPQVVSAAAHLDVPDHRGWQFAQPMRLHEATQAQVLKLLRQLTEALGRRDLNTVVNLLNVKVSERARAYGATAAEKLGQLRRNYTELMGRPNWAIEPWEDEDARMELIAENRLIRITNPDGKPLIRSVDLGGARLVVPTDVTYVNGRWTILR